MTLSQFKDPLFYMYLAGAMLASQSLRQEVSGSNPFTVIANDSVKTFRENRKMSKLSVIQCSRRILLNI